MKKLILIITIVLLSFCNLFGVSSGDLLDTWDDEEAYKPMPILFLHGFGPGGPGSWNDLVSYLAPYYQPYQDITPAISDSISYLERIDFQDPNGSVDRYDPGSFNPQGNSAGWGDKVGIAVDDMLENIHYGSYTDKVILIAHSMGGLAAREYITTGGAGNVEKLITLNTPHAGTTLGNIAQDVNKTRAIGWKIPLIGWLYSAELAQVDRTLNIIINIDLDGEAAIDTAIGSDFLTDLNIRFQPDIPSFAISAHLGHWLNSFFFHPYYPSPRTPYSPRHAGDIIVPIDSQEGYDVYTNPGESRRVWEFDYIVQIIGDHSAALQDAQTPFPREGDDSTFDKILQWIDSERPEIEITAVKVVVKGVEREALFEGGMYRINGPSCILEGSVTREFFPANTILNVTIQREGEAAQTIINDMVLLPDDSWIPGDLGSVVAGFKETINFPRPGTYEVTTKVINPAGRESDQEVITIEAEFTQPIIEPISPTPGQIIADRHPTIQARIYSPVGIDIDLETVVVWLDSVVVSYVYAPPEGGSDITISYIPISDLDYGVHTITVSALDINEAPANEAIWTFEIGTYQPVIEPINPRDGGIIGDRRPNIQARIYTSLGDGIVHSEGPDINLESIVMELDGIIVNHAVNPPEGGTEINISYIPEDDLILGLHTVTVNASDVNGTSAEEISWEFEVWRQISTLAIDLGQVQSDVPDWSEGVGIVMGVGYYDTTDYPDPDFRVTNQRVRGYVKFDLRPYIGQTILYAELKIDYFYHPWYLNAIQYGVITFDVHETSSTWEGDSLTWNTQPGLGEYLASFGVNAGEGFVPKSTVLDVTDYVVEEINRGSSNISFMIKKSMEIRIRNYTTLIHVYGIPCNGSDACQGMYGPHLIVSVPDE